jgi:hypothetical protein
MNELKTKKLYFSKLLILNADPSISMKIQLEMSEIRCIDNSIFFGLYEVSNSC